MKRRRPTAVVSPTPTVVSTAPTPAGVVKAADWPTEYAGYGSVLWGTNGVTFAPKASTTPGETHAVLLLNNKGVAKDFVATIKVTTLQQLRTPTPNAWETFWFMFNYVKTPDGKKECNYLTLKPNGLEVGTCYAEIGQQFLYTSGLPKLVIGKSNTILVEKVGTHLSVTVDGTPAMVGANLSLYDAAGTIGLYCEDAKCLVESVGWTAK